jgi:hypothetical protein
MLGGACFSPPADRGDWRRSTHVAAMRRRSIPLGHLAGDGR